MSTPADMPQSASSTIGGQRRLWKPFGLIALVAAVIVPSVAFAKVSNQRHPSATIAAARSSDQAPAVAAEVEPAAAMASSATSEATRADLEQYFDQLQTLVDSQQFAPEGSPQLALPAADLSTAVQSARSAIDELDAGDLSAWQALVDLNPGWNEQPDILAEAVAANPFDLGDSQVAGYRAPSMLANVAGSSTGRGHALAASAAAGLAPAALRAPGDPDGIYSDCEIDQPNIRGLFYSAWIATQLAGAAGALASGVPDSVDWVPLLIFAGVAFGVANGIAIALNHALTFALDCSAAKDDAEFRQTLPKEPGAVSPTNPTGIVPGSTQTSVDELSSAVAGVAATLTTVQAVILQILNDQLIVVEALGIATNSATQIQVVAENLQERAKDLGANIGTPTDQASEANRNVDCVPTPPPGTDACNTSNGLANTTDTRLDTIADATKGIADLSLRTSIERALADPSHQAVALFALPAASGGHLETVADIVAQTIANLTAAGQGTGSAMASMASANAKYLAGDFVGAYVDYSFAYQAAVR